MSGGKHSKHSCGKDLSPVFVGDALFDWVCLGCFSLAIVPKSKPNTYTGGDELAEAVRKLPVEYLPELEDEEEAWVKLSSVLALLKQPQETEA